MTISRITVKNEKELQKILVNDVSVVEGGLTVICSDMPIDPQTSVDVLCHDEDGQLAIMKLSVKQNDDMFFEALKILAYVNNVKPILKFSYKDFKISDSKTPRLIFLAPSFSAQLVDVVGQMQGIQMDLYAWEYFEFDDKKAFHLEPVWLSEATKSKPRKPKSEKSKQKKTAEEPEEPKPEPEKVTEEAIVPPEEVEMGSASKESKDKTKKKSIFSI